VTINDLHDLVRLLREHPEWQAELRRLILTDELLELPSLVRQLVEAQRRTEEQVAQLTEAQRRTEEALGRTQAQVAQLIEAQRRTEEQVAQLTEAQRRTEEALGRTQAQVAQLIEAQRRTEEQVAQLTEAQRRTEEALGRTQAQVAQLIEAQRRTEEQVAQLIEAQRRTEEALGRTQAQVAQLIEAQRRTEEQVASLSEVQRENQERLNQLTEAVKQLSEEVKRLVEWQRGEAGRREGERYERRLIKRAPVLFRGGKGGATDSPLVQEQLIKWLQPLFAEDRIPPAEEDPSLADIIWWKGTKVLIGEVSYSIDRHDVLRILQRARTLRQVGVDAIPFVAGNGWATPEAEFLAQELGVEWMIDSTPSAGLIAFRKLPDPATTPEPPPAG
jgi:ABC-type transporter Mla subunit MlaD